MKGQGFQLMRSDQVKILAGLRALADPVPFSEGPALDATSLVETMLALGRKESVVCRADSNYFSPWMVENSRGFLAPRKQMPVLPYPTNVLLDM